jgi:nucleotide-binding universal stress UspA family protein
MLSAGEGSASGPNLTYEEPSGGTSMFSNGRILHPMDFSPRSQRAFELACAMARVHQARILVLHVAPVPAIGTESMMLLPPDPEQFRGEIEAKMRSQLQALPGVDIEE